MWCSVFPCLIQKRAKADLNWGGHGLSEVSWAPNTLEVQRPSPGKKRKLKFKSLVLGIFQGAIFWATSTCTWCTRVCLRARVNWLPSASTWLRCNLSPPIWISKHTCFFACTIIDTATVQCSMPTYISKYGTALGPRRTVISNFFFSTFWHFETVLMFRSSAKSGKTLVVWPLRLRCPCDCSRLCWCLFLLYRAKLLARVMAAWRQVIPSSKVCVRVCGALCFLYSFFPMQTVYGKWIIDAVHPFLLTHFVTDDMCVL